MLGPFLEVEMAKNCFQLWRTTFGSSDVILCGGRKGIVHLVKRHLQNHGRRGAFEEVLQRCISRVQSRAIHMFIIHQSY